MRHLSPSYPYIPLPYIHIPDSHVVLDSSLLYTVGMNNILPPDTVTLASLASLGSSLDIASDPEQLPEIPSPAPSPSPSPSNHYSVGPSSSVEEKALKLLGAGIDAETVASAVGVTPGRISQLLSDTVFAGKVTALRYVALQSHNVRDGKYDSLEDKLLEKLEKSVALMYKPETLLRAITTVNSAKRRGQAAASSEVITNKNIINLILPSVITNKFSVDINNQVTRAGDQDLLTMPSGNLLKQVEDANELRISEATAQDTHPIYDTQPEDGEHCDEEQQGTEPRA